MGENIEFVQMCQALRHCRHPPPVSRPLFSFLFPKQKQRGRETATRGIKKKKHPKED